MPIRFRADADFNQIIVAAVVRRMPNIDFRTATAAGLASLNNADVLTVAAAGGCILVTHDQATMPTQFGRFTGSNPSPGLIVVPQSLAIRKAADSLILIWAARYCRSIQLVFRASRRRATTNTSRRRTIHPTTDACANRPSHPQGLSETNSGARSSSAIRDIHTRR